MQHERINVRAQLSHHEGNTVGHEAADKVNIAAEPIQLGDGYVALEFLGSSEGGLELRATVKGIRTFARLHLHKLPDQLQTFSLCELTKRLALGFDAKP
jgi:hypothetical protein